MSKPKSHTVTKEGSTTVVEVHDTEQFLNQLNGAVESMKEENETKIYVHKAKVKPSSIFIKYTTQINGSVADLDMESGCTPHKDLFEAMNAMKIHLVHLCDIREFIEYVPGQHHFIPNITVTGITIAGEGDDEGVVITGTKKIGSKILNLNSPFTKFSDDHEEYEFSRELSENVQNIIEEVRLFITTGKNGNPQQEIPFEQ